MNKSPLKTRKRRLLEVKLLKMVMNASNRPRVEVPMYEGNINVEELMEWIIALNKYFDLE